MPLMEFQYSAHVSQFWVINGTKDTTMKLASINDCKCTSSSCQTGCFFTQTTYDDEMTKGPIVLPVEDTDLLKSCTENSTAVCSVFLVVLFLDILNIKNLLQDCTLS